jgi:transcription antitermination factor NusG
MEIEEDPEAMWYLLNCVAGLEIDLLNQCRQACDDMEDVKKFVVPTEVKTRSHGANRMVVDTKVKYQGYVFAKLRLCAQTYEAIQSKFGNIHTINGFEQLKSKRSSNACFF